MRQVHLRRELGRSTQRAREQYTPEYSDTIPAKAIRYGAGVRDALMERLEAFADMQKELDSGHAAGQQIGHRWHCPIL